MPSHSIGPCRCVIRICKTPFSLPRRLAYPRFPLTATKSWRIPKESDSTVTLRNDEMSGGEPTDRTRLFGSDIDEEAAAAGEDDSTMNGETTSFLGKKGGKRKRRGNKERWWSERRNAVILAVGFVLALLVSVTVFVVVAASKRGPDLRRKGKTGLIIAEHGAVAAEEGSCSQVGVDVLKEGGSAVDAAIASALCIGTVNSFSSGIGGGGFMVIRMPNGTAEVIEFREAAPAAANKTMFVNNPILARFGGLSVGVPGEIRGFELAHRRHGRLPWKRLFEPCIRMSREGFRVPAELARRLQLYHAVIDGHKEWEEIYAPNGTLKIEGDIIKRENFAATLQIIAEEGADAFYTGSIAKSIVDTVRSHGGILTLEDMRNYHANLRQPLVGYYHGRRVFTSPEPSSGPVLLHALNVLEGYELSRRGMVGVNVHRLVEALKFGYAQRTELGDFETGNNTERVAEIITKDFAARVRRNISDDVTFPPEHYRPKFDVQEDHGTTHVSAVDHDDMAVALTSTINLIFGSQIMDRSTGVILNDEMDDFSIPGIPNTFGLRPSPFNFAAPGKRPLSSSVPAVIEQDGRMSLALGASGGSHIITATLQVLLNVYDLGLDLIDAVDRPRLHHQLIPNRLDLEANYPTKNVHSLTRRGHEIQIVDSTHVLWAVQAVMRHGSGTYHAASDFRKNGMAAGY